MRRVFLFSSDPGPSGPAALVGRLAAGLPRDRFEVRVGVVGGAGKLLGDASRSPDGAGPVLIRWRWPVDPRGWAELRRTVTAFEPDILHAVGPGAVRLAGLLLRSSRTRRPVLVASGADRPVAGAVRWLTRYGLRSAARVTARTPAEAGRYKALGVPAERITVIPPGVSPPLFAPDADQVRKSLGIPDGGRLVVAAGRFDAAAGLKSAVWAFDVVKYAHPDLYLVLAGDGPERPRLERFARGLAADDFRVRFAGERAELPALLKSAEVAWVTHERGGVQTALEAMAGGVPVVAARTPDLLSVIEDGVTGRLVPPSDRVRLAAITHELLGSPEEARRLGAAGRDRVAAEFPPGRLIERFAALYDDLTAA